MKKLVIGSVAMMAATASFGAGFGIYEASARGLAMGDAIVGDVSDATANYHNPANLANATNIQVALGATLINPFYDVSINHHSQDRMNAGWFTVPHFYLTVPLPFDFAFGWGNYTEYGAGTEYKGDWLGKTDSISTGIEQFTMNPNLSYKVTDWWNVSVGMRVSNFRFVHHKGVSQYPNSAGIGPDYFDSSIHSKVKGDDWGMGWNAAMSFKPHEDVTIGLVYRSQIRHKISGKSVTRGSVDTSGLYNQLYDSIYNGPSSVSGFTWAQLETMNPALKNEIHQGIASGLAANGVSTSTSANTFGRASGKVTLPDSLVLGVNWDATDRFRVGSAITYTRWSSVDTIRFKLPSGTTPLKLGWKDTVRVGFGMEYDFLDWLSGRIGYMYDRDPGSSHHMNTLIPLGDRHIICFGSGVRLMENLYLDLAYSFIRMNNEHGTLSNGQRVSFSNGGSHLVAATVRYEF